MSLLLQLLLDQPFSLRFARYRPAPRLGTRHVETRLLRRLMGRSVFQDLDTYGDHELPSGLVPPRTGDSWSTLKTAG